MTAVTAHLEFPGATASDELDERRRIARLIGLGSASFTAIIAIVALVLALVA